MTAYLSLAPRSLALIPGAHLFDSCHMCTVIASQCMAAHRSCICPVGSGENVLPFFLLTWEGSHWSVTRISLWNLVSVSTLRKISSSLLLLLGGCFIRKPASSTPFVAFCLACAASPTWLPFPASAGSRSAVQIMVSQPRQIHWKGLSICAHFLSQLKNKSESF